MARKLSLYAGQGVGKIDRIMSAAERVEELVKGLSDERESVQVDSDERFETLRLRYA